MSSLHAKIEKITYRKWDDIYKMSNDKVEVLINPSSGGRVAAFTRNGINVIWEDSTQNGKYLKDYIEEGFDPDGGRFDLAPEHITQGIHHTTYMGAWKVEMLNDHALKIISPKDTLLGMQCTRIFQLDENEPFLKITLTMTNISDDVTNYWFWGRTLVNTGGTIFTTLKADSKFPEKWIRYIWKKNKTLHQADLNDKGVQVKNNLFVLDPLKANNQKYATDGTDGWMAYHYKSLLFIKTFDVFPHGEYPENGFTHIFYTNHTHFAEMEPVSPLATLPPGDTYSFTENWHLLEEKEVSDKGFTIKKAAEFISHKLK